MKTVLVTGATGFVASHLLPVLHRQGCQIIAAVRNHWIRDLSIPVKTNKINEIDRKTNWHSALLGVDTVIHLAARAHILHEDIPNPEAEFLKVNTEGTANLIKQSIEAGVKHFVFISSIGAMATLSDQILTESSPCLPNTPYGLSKLKAEQALTDLTKNNSMTWTILRPTLVYGPGNPGNMERLMKLINRGFPLPFASLYNRRSFVFVGNLVDAIATCISHPKATGETFLISDGEAVSTPELIRRIANALDQPARLFPMPPNWLERFGQFTGSSAIERLLGSLTVDSRKIQQTLHWQPPFTMTQGLQATADWYLQRQNSTNN